jgi:hypothetical protein
MTRVERKRPGQRPGAANEGSRVRERAGAWRLGLRSALGLVFLLGIPLAGQVSFQQSPSINNGRVGQNYPEPNGMGQDANSPDQKRVRLLNAERQKALVSDTEKLLKLAKELNDEVAVSESGTMSDEQLRKVAEIGKLAKSVKDKMSYTLGGFPGFGTPLTVQPPIQ